MAPNEPRAAGADHRQTAADWHGGQSSPLYAYASTGTVVTGIDTEIRSCLAHVDRGDLPRERDPEHERERLQALLHHVEPDIATVRAHEIGREHAEHAVAWWHQEVLGGRASGDTAATARWVLQGIDHGDPAVLDALPGPPGDYTADDLATDCGSPEPQTDDRAAASQVELWDAYTTAFRGAVQDAVVQYCEDELADPTPPGPGVPEVQSTVGSDQGALRTRLARPRSALDPTSAPDAGGTWAPGLEL
jgi:hypothetical protein